jgi:hypothetical protein
VSCELAHLDAAYVLGSLSPSERADYERHLRTCDECSRSVRELAGLPGLLARVPADVLEPLDRDPVPTTLLPALVAAAERHQRRRTIRTALLTAAAVAVIAVGSAVVASSLDDEETPVSAPPVVVETTAPAQRMMPVGDSRSTGWVSLTPAGMGTRLDLTCVYESSYSGTHEYALSIVTTDGRHQDVEIFEATTGEEVRVSGETATDPDEIEKVVVKNSYGDAILLLTP